jgi:hypothetical protein
MSSAPFCPALLKPNVERALLKCYNLRMAQTAPMLINSVFAFVRCSLAIPVLNMAACMVLAIDNTNKSTSSTTEKVIVLKEFSVHSKLRKVG